MVSKNFWQKPALLIVAGTIVFIVLVIFILKFLNPLFNKWGM